MDLYKTWTYAGELDPIRRREVNKDIEGAGVTVPDAIQDIRSSGEYWGASRGLIKLRDSNDFVDLSSITNRQSRYKEYERLRVVPEIENSITIFADEACVTGDTLVATPFGYIPMKTLAQNKQPGERFLVYCYDFSKKDYTLGWAHSPRKVKREKTVTIIVEDGESFECTRDHRVLLANGEWIEAGRLMRRHELMPFYRMKANTNLKKKQQHRIFTHNDGWVNEKDFIDEWQAKKRSSSKDRLYKIISAMSNNCTKEQIATMMGVSWLSCWTKIKENGFSYKELNSLRKKPKSRCVISVIHNKEEKIVYDLSVDEHENFCTDIGVMHNCQIGENGHMFDIHVKNQDVKDELEFLFFHPSMLNIDNNLWGWARDLFLFGDHFIELVIDPDEPKLGILKVQVLPPESIYRIETIKGRVVEFQQSKEGPDYQSLSKVEVTKASNADLAQATALRFAPQSIVHFKIGGNRKTFAPYGVSLIEAARGPAHQLKLLEDAMLIYRLSRSPERKVFYIDVGQMPPFKAEAFISRLQDMFRKKKTYSSKGGTAGATTVEERWQAPSQDEDFWIPTRPNSNTRVETLPGITGLGEVDDVKYFRDKLFVSMAIPKGYMAQEDPAVTKMTLSSVDVKFSKLIERLQRNIAAGIIEIAVRHLTLRGFPVNLFDDLQIKMTPPSHYREISENEVKDARVNRFVTLKGTMALSDYDLLVDILRYSEEEAKEKVSRSMIQKLQELKLQVMSANPQLLGIAMPQPKANEMGTDAEGPNATEIPGQEPEAGNESQPEMGTEPQDNTGAMDSYGKPPVLKQGNKLPNPTDEEIRKYDMEITDFSKGIDEEEIDEFEVG